MPPAVGDLFCAVLATTAPSATASSRYAVDTQSTATEPRDRVLISTFDSGHRRKVNRAALADMTENWIANTLDEIGALAQLPVDWSGYECERPSARAIAIAKDIAAALIHRGQRPEPIVPMADGGIMMRVAAGQRVVRLDVYNDGGIAIVTQLSPSSPPHYDDVDETRAVTATIEFLRPV